MERRVPEKRKRRPWSEQSIRRLTATDWTSNLENMKGSTTNIQKWHEPDPYTLDFVETFVSFHLWGTSFSPKRMTRETGIVFTEANEPDEVNVTGPYRGRPLTHGRGYGAAIIRAPENCRDGIGWLSEYLFFRFTRKFREEYEIQEEILYLTAHFKYKQDCRLMLNDSTLRSIPVGVPLVITSVQETEPPDSFAV